MFFIYVIVMFATLSCGSFASALLVTTPNTIEVLNFVGGLFGVSALICLVVGFFYQLAIYNQQRITIAEHLRECAKLENDQATYNAFKVDFSTYYTKNYPEYEKEVFQNMNPTDQNELTALMVKYPELKQSTSFDTYTQQCVNYLNRINKQRERVLEKECELKQRLSDPWLIIKVPAV